MKRFNFVTATALIVAAVAISIFVISCATVERVVVAPPMIPGAKYVGMDTCATCHEKQVKDFKMTSHSRIVIPGEGERVEGQGCESCHGPGSLHVDAGGGRGVFIINPKKSPDGCFQCHLDKHAEFSLPFRHPVKEGRMSCTDCHDVHGSDVHVGKGTMMARINDRCAKCHREQTSPKVFEHEALREGCTVCHSVHGSINNKMLKERDANLCIKCHAQVVRASGQDPRSIFVGTGNHMSRLAGGTCWSAGCHTAVHGSNINAHLRY